jgi:DNA-binding IclR family transcriptional regulator
MNEEVDSMLSPSSGVLDMQEIMQYLKENGQRFDSEIAAATGLSLAKVRRSITDLSARGEISKCSVTRFNNGEKIEAVLCRVAGYIPPKSPGRKPGASS